MAPTRVKLPVVGAAVFAILIGIAYGGATSRAAPQRRPGELVARLHDVNGNRVGGVRLMRAEDGSVRINARAAALTPGFHGFHVHTIGQCDPKAKDATGATVPFFSAGGHYNPDTTQTHGAHAGDMPTLLVRDDGSAMLSFTTDRFGLAELIDADGSAVIVHAAPDNLAHIPATTPTGSERYHSHVDDVLGPDSATKATGDAGARFACGVIERISR